MRGARRRRRVAYVQLGGGALPVSLSDTLRLLKARRLLETAIAVSPCLDGDVQCVTVGVGAARGRRREGFDVVVCGIGPGIVGTGSTFGHGGLAVADAANVAAALGGAPIVALRVSYGDPASAIAASRTTRARRSRSSLGTRTVAWPHGLDRADELATSSRSTSTAGERRAPGLPLYHMGRGPDDDPWFFAAAFAAGRHARSLLR